MNKLNIMTLELKKPTIINGELKYSISHNTLIKLKDLENGVIDKIRVKYIRHSSTGLKPINIEWTRHTSPHQQFECAIYDSKSSKDLRLVDFDFMYDSITADQQLEHNVLPLGEALSRIRPVDHSGSFLIPILDEWICIPGCTPNTLSVQWRVANVYHLYISCVPQFIFSGVECAIGLFAYDMTGESIVGIVGARNATNKNYSLLCDTYRNDVVNLNSGREIVITIHDFSTVTDSTPFKYLKAENMASNINELRNLEASDKIDLSKIPNRIIINQLNGYVNVNILSEIGETISANNNHSQDSLDTFDDLSEKYIQWVSFNYREKQYKYSINKPLNTTTQIAYIPISVKKVKYNRKLNKKIK